MARLTMLAPRVPVLGAHDTKRQAEQIRGTAHERGYGARWRRARLTFLREHPLCQCEDCQGGKLRVTAATVVDHHIPHRGDPHLFWDTSNWRAMSKPCHDRKTAKQDGGFGNPRA